MRERTAVGWAVLLIVALVVAAACGADPPRELPPLRGPEASEPTDDEIFRVDPGSQLAEFSLELPEWPRATVTVIDAGAEPHELRQLAPEPNAVFPMRTFTSRNASVRIAGVTETEDAPGIDIDTDVRVRAVADGIFVVDEKVMDYTIHRPETVDRVTLALLRSELNDQLGSIDRYVRRVDGSTVNAATLNPSGSVRDEHSPVPDTSLPPQPIGLGARWKVVSSTLVEGIVFEASYTLELTEIHPDRLVARYEGTLTPRKGHTTFDGMEVLSGSSHNSGTVTWVLWAGMTLVDGAEDTQYTLRFTERGRTIEGWLEQSSVTRATPR